MASQLRFEGPDLEELLDRVRTEVGADARIVAANKVRKGGIGGFFSREYFEVVLEGDETDAPEPAPMTKAPSGARSADVTPRAAQVTTRKGGRRASGRSVPASVLDRPAATSILELAEDVNDDERRSTPTPTRSSRSSHDPADDIDRTADNGDEIDLREGPRVTAESDRFASILERLAREATAPGGGGSADDDEEEEEFVADDHQLHAMNGSHAGRGAAAAARNGTAAPPRRLQTAVRPTDDTPELRARAEAAAIAADEKRRTAAAVAAAAAAAAAGGLAPAAAPGFVAPAAPELPNVRRRGVNPPDVIERPENRLARLGVPARMIPRNVAPRELQGALIESLARLPVAPPLPGSNGVVIAVVGLGSAPVVLARELSTELGLDPDRVVLATSDPLGEGVPSWLQITDAPTAEERRRSWRRRGNPTIVALSVPVGRAGLGWARTILDELEPTMVWSIVEAGSKPEDIRHWEERLGGIDQLQITRLEETVSPAAVLELGIPVGRLERHLATPVAWAEMLLYRMGAER